ncbi:hypothetical protein M407DRAFT_14811 [Tulasnella calospora MUT 4182]|uniref:tRNA-5-taurinomethyluridine 2-sulfurtransferase n=1 Tax=Tulasnella calospora MUT 4182 TaxID=1051891 RepID=A0A0C3QKR0_9AGAM|nr:hypothetical protein M407DRAFT_14811 [Tulasnella calospora MUT 4182]
MSGGVDSSVAAALLAEKDLDLSAVFMRNWDKRDESGTDIGCQWEKDWEDVRRVCQVLDIPVRMIDLSQQYWTRVFEPSLDEWQRGLTPNPDVPCNREVKFGALMDQALSGSNQWLATGHYTRTANIEVRPNSRRRALLKAKDPIKDQSYFLSSVSQRQLSKAAFPLGDLLKSQVREIAKAKGLPTASRPESMGLCFVGQKEGRIDRFLSDYIPPEPGPIVDLEGRVMGEHKGLWTYTIGQGARISGQLIKLFVAGKDPSRNAIIVVPGSDHPALFSLTARTSSWHWIADEPPPQLQSDNSSLEATVKICYGERQEQCVATRDGEGLHLSFKNPIRGVTPGQYAVLYDGDICLGSGKMLWTDAVDKL